MRVDAEKAQFYHRDGRFSPFMMLLLLPISLLVSIGMAISLCLLHNWYYFIITPLVVSLPVWGMIFLTIHFGKCRNIVVAIVIGLLLFGTYYAGFWLLDYAIFSYDYGEEGLQAVEETGGSRGIIGYFHFRCKTTVVEEVGTSSKDENPDPVGGYLFYGAELLTFLVSAIVFPAYLSKRVYYKDLKRWGTSQSFVLHKEDGVDAFQAIVNHDWEALARVPKMPPTTQGIRVQLYRLKFEYLKNNPDAAIYISLTGLGKKEIAEMSFAHDPPRKMLCGSIKQWKIEPDSGRVLAHYFPELGLTVPVPEEADTEVVEAVDEESQEGTPSDWTDS